MQFCSIGITRFKEDDILLIKNISYLILQKKVRAEILILDQSSALRWSSLAYLFKKLSSKKIKIKYYPECKFSGLSVARNFVLKNSIYKKVLFLDCDAMACPDWAFQICSELTFQNTAIVGTKIIPVWANKPNNIHRHPLIRSFYSLLDLGSQKRKVPKIIWASFGLHKDKIDQDFDENLGYALSRRTWGEETDMCRHVSARGYDVIYVGTIFVYHIISAKRMELSYLCSSLYYTWFFRWINLGRPQPHNSLLNIFYPINFLVYMLFIVYLLWYGHAIIIRQFQSPKGGIFNR